MRKENYHRRSIRLPTYDYSQFGYYYVTICAQNFKCCLGNVDRAEMKLSLIGQMIDNGWQELKNKFNCVDLDEYQIMPNHLHGIVVIKDNNGTQHRRGEPMCSPHNSGLLIGQTHRSAPTDNRPTLGQIIQWFKTMTTNYYIQGVKIKNWPRFSKRFWQRNYYEHIIRNEESLDQICEYIEKNPENWEYDRNNPLNIKKFYG